jgi:hypothetical protein
VNDEEGKERKPALARWVEIVQPASLSTTTGTNRFLITIRLPEKSSKTATKFVQEMNDALKSEKRTAGGEQTSFLLVDSERARLQRATASFPTFKQAQSCLGSLKKLGLPVNEISAELEDFGTNKYDPWHESIRQSWWPWFAALRNPPPEMPMMKITNRLDVSEGSKYKQSARGKLGQGEEADRDDAEAEQEEKKSQRKKGSKKKSRKDNEDEET